MRTPEEIREAQLWYTRLPAYQVDAIANLIHSAEQVVRQNEQLPEDYRHSYISLCFRQVWKDCVEALGGEVTNPTF